MENQDPQVQSPAEQTPQTPPVPENSNRNFWKTIGIGMSIVSVCLAIGIGGYLYVANKNTAQKACTMEAKLCSDGSSVGRTGPKCEFAPCPTTTPTPPASEYIPGKVIFGLKEGFTAQNAQEIASKVNAKIINSIPEINAYVLQVGVGEETKIIELIKNYPEVKYAELNGIIRIPDCSKGPC